MCCFSNRSQRLVNRFIIWKGFSNVGFQQHQVCTGAVALGVDSSANKLHFAEVILRRKIVIRRLIYFLFHTIFSHAM